MLPASVQGQGYRVSNATLDVVTGTEGPPEWEAAFLRYGTVYKTTTTTIDGSGASVAVRRWLYKRGASSGLCDEPADRERGRRPGGSTP
jgi:hypothetical protein